MFVRFPYSEPTYLSCRNPENCERWTKINKGVIVCVHNTDHDLVPATSTTFTHTFTRTHTFTHTHTHSHTHTHIHTHTHTQTATHLHSQPLTQRHTDLSTYTHYKHPHS